MENKGLRGLITFHWIILVCFLFITCSWIYAEGEEPATEGTKSTIATGNWAWISGDSAADRPGVYGEKGVAAGANKPCARYNSVNWVDNAGNFWLFGGDGDDARGVSQELLNDLWKFDGTCWIWVSGNRAANQSSVYGVKGVAAPTNKPGARYGSISWIDRAGNLWLFGGNGIYSKEGRGSKKSSKTRGDNTKKARGGKGREYSGSNDEESPMNSYKEVQQGLLNDLWKFDGTNWTWVSGDDIADQRGVYGVKGVTSTANKPGARDNSICWIDSAGNFWLFGGNGIDGEGTQGYLNDLWKFDGTNWTWGSGDNTAYGPTNYGVKGIAAETNKAGGRCGSVSWIDRAGNLWLFGGIGIDATGAQGYLNDLWKFDGKNWIWMSGDNTVNQSGRYGSVGVAASENKPGARENSVSWKDNLGNFWLFGGNGFNSAGMRGWLNDLWKFDGTNWTWVSGSNSVNRNGVYGTKGVLSGENKPGAREGSINWKDNSGNLWLFGGTGYDGVGTNGALNDLWKFIPLAL